MLTSSVITTVLILFDYSAALTVKRRAALLESFLGETGSPVVDG